MHAERAMGESQEEEALVVCDADGLLVFANTTATSILGYVRIGANVDDYSCMHGLFTEDGRPYPSRDLPLSRALLDREVVRNAYLVVRRCDGTSHLISVSARPLFDPAGDILGGAATFKVVDSASP